MVGVEFGKYNGPSDAERKSINAFADTLDPKSWAHIPLVVLVDDIDFAASNFETFLWVTFTRSNPVMTFTALARGMRLSTGPQTDPSSLMLV